jgi:hypothetical protein
MTTTPTKSLAQVAYEAESPGRRMWFGPWEQTPAWLKAIYEKIAAAVAEAVRREQTP